MKRQRNILLSKDTWEFKLRSNFDIFSIRQIIWSLKARKLCSNHNLKIINPRNTQLWKLRQKPFFKRIY